MKISSSSSNDEDASVVVVVVDDDVDEEDDDAGVVHGLDVQIHLPQEQTLKRRKEMNEYLVNSKTCRRCSLQYMQLRFSDEFNQFLVTFLFLSFSCKFIYKS